MNAQLKNVANINPDLAQDAFDAARMQKRRLFVCEYPDGRPAFLTVGEFMGKRARGETLPRRIATATPGGIVH